MHRLRDAGFNMDKVSVVAKNPGSIGDVAGANVPQNREDQVRDGTGAGAVAGSVTGGLVGLFGSLSVLAIPGVGPIAEAGIVLANTLLGSGLGAAGGGLLGALIGWGIPEDQAQYYHSRVYDGNDYLIMVEGNKQEISSAESILGDYQVRDWNIFGASNAATPANDIYPRAGTVRPY
jgi:uncharacterized membrane protein